MKATRKSATVISPARSRASSNASGIIMSADIAGIAPVATADGAAITSSPSGRKTA